MHVVKNYLGIQLDLKSFSMKKLNLLLNRNDQINHTDDFSIGKMKSLFYLAENHPGLNVI